MSGSAGLNPGISYDGERWKQKGRRYKVKEEGDGAQEVGKGRMLTRRQVALIHSSHLLSQPRQLTDSQGPDEDLYPANPTLELMEEVPECVPVPYLLVGSPQLILEDSTAALLRPGGLVFPPLRRELLLREH